MNMVLDGQSVFDEQQLEIELGSVNRSSMEKTVPGLDGVLSVDLGGRSRVIKQKGILRAKSRRQMNDRIGLISAYMDGKMHTLVTDSGEEFDNLRMDVFKAGNQRTGGSSVVVDYEIVYTQLQV
ncbi:MAG: hypothetical protein AMJ75_00620 [Phycisphaerae bacterium SM1_79]|nr:MAG: hypothetical protein AMJ75_00620 [Phycisphaerae bacterium SM1_79]